MENKGFRGTPFWAMSKEVKARTIKKLRNAKLGEKNPNWKGGPQTEASGRTYARLKYPEQKPCEICGTEPSVRHHRDGNPLNNSPENIQRLCHKHHDRIHKKIHLPLEEIKHLYKHNLWSSTALAKKYGVHPSTILRRLHERGIYR